MVAGYFLHRYQKHIEARLNRRPGSRFVAMFHQIGEKEDWYDARYSMSFSQFERFVCGLREGGYDFVPPQGIMSDGGTKKAVLSFDDVFDGVYYRVYPFLRRQNIPFAVFPSICNLDAKGYVTRQMLEEMAREYGGCHVGAHGITHCSLAGCSKKKAYEEIVGSGDMLERAIRRKVELFAYPYGSLAEVGPREIRIAGTRYRMAFGTLQAGVTGAVNTMYIPRVNINGGVAEGDVAPWCAEMWQARTARDARPYTWRL